MQDWVGQFKGVVEVGLKVSITMFLACSCAMGVDYYAPAIFAGLPEWVMPLVRLCAILFGVISIVSILIAVASRSWKIFQKILTKVKVKIKLQRVKGNLLSLDVGEVAIISIILDSGSRSDLFNEDHISVISLQRKGIITRQFSFVAYQDNQALFELEEELWVHLHKMPEFNLPQRFKVRSMLNSNFDEREKLKFLPQKHPAIKSYFAQLDG